MALAADHSTMPTAAVSGGLVPDDEPRFVQALAEHWQATNDDDKPTALGTRVRHSDAGKCARAIAYTVAGVPKSNPMDLTGVWNVNLGTVIHEAWQQSMVEAWVARTLDLPDDATVTIEIEPKVGHDDLDASGHLDAVITITYADGTTWVIVYELKTIGGYGFKAAIGKARRGTPAEGPKLEHRLQAALNGIARDADEIVIGYLAKECISVGQAGKLDELGRFAAEWTFDRDTYRPWAVAEKDRLNGILALLDRGELAARKFPVGMLPAGAEIVDPDAGRWEVRHGDQVADTGTWWACGYCSFQSLCATTPAGRIPVEIVTKKESAA